MDPNSEQIERVASAAPSAFTGNGLSEEWVELTGEMTSPHNSYRNNVLVSKANLLVIQLLPKHFFAQISV